MYSAFMAEVNVNTKTGKTTVEGMTTMADVGKINNKLAVHPFPWSTISTE
jgi:aldehyde oxidoreductase